MNLALAEDARIRLGGGPIDRKTAESDSVDERIRQSQEYIQQRKDRGAGYQKEKAEIRRAQVGMREQIEKIVQAEIAIEARKH